MRGLVGSVLGLALGWAATAVSAQDHIWRPVQANTGTATANHGISLRAPVPLDEPPANPVTPVSFNTATAVAQPFVRAKTDQPPQPMPLGPPTIGGGATIGEPIAAPTTPPTPIPGSPNSVVSRWIDDGTALHGNGAVMVPGGDGCCVGGCGDGCSIGGCGDGCCPGGCCPDDCCGCPTCWGCGGCCQMSRVWASAEYLMWWSKGMGAPPLVTSSPGGTPQAAAGVLGPGTTVLFPRGDDIDFNMFSGGRVTVGFSLPSMPCLGFEATYFSLGRGTTNFNAGGTGNPEISRPITNAQTGLPDAELVAFPGLTSGNVSVVAISRLWGVEGNARYQLLCGCNYRVDLLAGFRFLELDEDLNVTEDLTVNSTTVRAPAGSQILVYDSFNTKNSFYGGQVGIDGEYRWGKLFAGGSFKFAMGDMHEVVNINGNTVFIVPGVVPITQQGGLLTQRTNIGSYSSNKFAVIPQVGLKLGYQVTEHVRVWVGYDFLYASSVVRPGDQIDTQVNRSQLPTVFGPGTLVGAARPMPMFVSSDYWAQGVNFGLEIRY